MGFSFPTVRSLRGKRGTEYAGLRGGRTEVGVTGESDWGVFLSVGDSEEEFSSTLARGKQCFMSSSSSSSIIVDIFSFTSLIMSASIDNARIQNTEKNYKRLRTYIK